MARIGVVLIGVRTGRVFFWVREMGTNPPYGSDPRQLPSQVRATDHPEVTNAAGGGEMGVLSAGGSDGGSEF